MTVEAARWPLPERLPFEGRSVDLEPLSREHVGGLWRSALGAESSFDYLRYGPFASERDMLDQVVDLAGRADQPFWAVKPKSSGAAEGWLSLCDITPSMEPSKSAASGLHRHCSARVRLPKRSFC